MSVRGVRLALLLLLCAAAFWWRLGRLGLIDPDEPFYAQSSREMLAAHDWATPRIFGQPQFEKPILIYWLAMGSFRVFGENEFAARVPAALFATLLVLLTWAFGSRVLPERAALLAPVILATSLEFFVSARMLLTDMVLAACVCASVFALWLACEEERRAGIWFLVACAASALAVLTKGPIGLIFPLFAWLALRLVGKRPHIPAWSFGLGAIAFAAIAAPWYAIMFAKYGSGYFRAFFLHENVDRFFHAEHRSNDHLWYYPAVLVGGAFPWIPALPTLLSRIRARAMWNDAARFLGFWALISLAFLTAAHSKLPSYSLFLFVPLALLLGRSLDLVLREGLRSRTERWVMAGLGLVQAAAFLIAPRLMPYRDLDLPLAVVAACLAVALILQIRRVSTSWVTVTAASSLALLVACLALGSRSVESIVSIRPLSREVTSQVQSSDTLLASPLLVRGVFYYTRHPVAVLTDRTQPFFTPHPLPVVRGPAGVSRLLEGGSSALCVLSAHEWRRLENGLSESQGATLDSLGGKTLARVSPSK